MTMQSHIAPAVHFEPFAGYAAEELAAAAPWAWGICFNAACGARFTPTRSWSRFCCAGCRRAFEAECRAWGARAAPGLLTHALLKRAKPASDQAATCRAARRHVTRIQSDWRDYRRKMEAAR